jgi:hypothetical protein
MKKAVLVIFVFFAPLLYSSCNEKGTAKDSVNAMITRTTLKNITIGLALYHQQFGEYPKTLSEFLVRKGITDRSVIEDGWGRTLHYTKVNDGYILFSNGRDGKPFTDDDLYPEKSPDIPHNA